MGKGKILGGSSPFKITNGIIREYYAYKEIIESQTFVETIAGWSKSIAGIGNEYQCRGHSEVILGPFVLCGFDINSSYYGPAAPRISVSLIEGDTVLNTDTLVVSVPFKITELIYAQRVNLSTTNYAAVFAFNGYYDVSSPTYSSRSGTFVYIEIDDKGKIVASHYFNTPGTYYMGSRSIPYIANDIGKVILNYNTGNNSNTPVTHNYTVTSTKFTDTGNIETNSTPIGLNIGDGIGMNGKNIYKYTSSNYTGTLEYAPNILGTFVAAAPISSTQIVLMSYRGSTLYFEEVYYEGDTWHESDTFNVVPPGITSYGALGVCYLSDDTFVFMYMAGTSQYPTSKISKFKFKNHQLVPMDYAATSYGNASGTSPMYNIDGRAFIATGSGSYYGPTSFFSVNLMQPDVTVKHSSTTIKGITKNKCTYNKAGKVYCLN